MSWYNRTRGILRSERWAVGLAFLLACFSWCVLTLVWILSPPGGIADRSIGALFSPAYSVGKHLAHIVFPNSSNRNPIAYHVAPLTGAAGEVLLLTVLCLIGIGVVRWMRASKHDRQV